MNDNAQQDGAGDLGIIWGAAGIAAALGVNERRAHYLLEKGALPGARKIGGRWAITRERLRNIFL